MSEIYYKRILDEIIEKRLRMIGAIIYLGQIIILRGSTAIHYQF